MTNQASNPLAPRGINPTPRDIGRKVVYITASDNIGEEGVITAFNDHYVFVRYGAAVNSQATSWEDLDWRTVRVSDLRKEHISLRSER